MTLNENSIFQYLLDLPTDILIIIMKYDGRMNYRNGIWMGKILKKDTRYRLLMEIPKPKYNKYTLRNVKWEYRIDLSKNKELVITCARDIFFDEKSEKTSDGIVYGHMYWNKIIIENDPYPPTFYTKLMNDQLEMCITSNYDLRTFCSPASSSKFVVTKNSMDMMKFYQQMNQPYLL